MTHFRTALISTAALCLILGGCGPKDKGGAALESADLSALNLDKAETEVFGPYFIVPDRAINESDAQSALATMGLDTPDPDGLNWSAREGENGTYTYTDLSATTEDGGTLTIGTATLYGVRQVQDEDGTDVPTFDRVDFQSLSLSEEDITLKAETLSIAQPSLAMARSLVASLSETAEMDVLDATDGLGFGAMSAKQITAESEEVSATLEQLNWALDDTLKQANGDIGAMNMTVRETPKAGEPTDILSTLTFEGASFRGVTTEGLDLAGAQTGTAGTILQQVNMFRAPYEWINVGALSWVSPAFDVDFAGANAASETKGKLTTITQSMKPLTIRIKDGAGADMPASAGRSLEMLESLGFSEMTFRGGSRSIMDEAADEIRLEDGLLVLEDGFRLNFEYAVQGLADFQAQAAKQADDPKLAELKAEMETAMKGEDFDEILAASERYNSYSQAQAAKLMGPLQLKNMRMSLDDNSIVERGMKLASEMTGQSEANLKRGLAMSVIAAPMMGRNDLESAMLGEGATAFVSFIKEGGTLTFAMNPPEPLPLSALVDDGGAELAPERVGFTARHDAP